MDFAALKTGLLSVFGLAISTVACVAGCEGTWEVPKEHFDGVNHLGYVTYWDKIAEIDIGEDAPFPIVIGFQSNRETSSPYLGYGWVMPLLESSMVQTGENTFEIMKPTGYTSGFGRDPKNASAIGGVQGWKGEIGSDTIKVWAPCGWSLTYTRGKITEIGTPKGKRIVIKRDLKGIVEYVSMDGRSLVKPIRGFGDKIEGVLIEDKKIDFSFNEKPHIANVGGMNVVTSKDVSIGQIATKRFEYGVTPNLQPKFTCIENGSTMREIVWNASDLRILSDGEWKYNVSPGLGRFENAKIERTNKDGKELWFRDVDAGLEVVQGTGGVKTTTYRFVSGVLSGQIRRIDEERNGLPETIYKARFDESGRLIAAEHNGMVTTFKFDDVASLKSATTKHENDILYHGEWRTDGRPVRLYKNGTTVSFDEKGRPKVINREGVPLYTFEFDERRQISIFTSTQNKAKYEK